MIANSPWRSALGLLVAVSLAGCATLPPGADFPKQPSVAFGHPEETPVGRQFASAAQEHQGESAFRIISAGADGFAARLEMIDGAQKTLDLQYYIFRGDETGELLMLSLERAANRGVRLRVLVDDGSTQPGDEQLIALRALPNAEIRIFNPFAYRGHSRFARSVEFLFNFPRLNYRMHNKLLVADNATALTGGRNIGDPYFQLDPDWQYADDDVFVAGPAVQKLSATFDEYWNSALAIPVEALGSVPSGKSLEHYQSRLDDEWLREQVTGGAYLRRAASGDPVAGIEDGRLPVVWATGQVVSDSPQKKRVKDGSMTGRLIYEPVAKAADAAQSELLMITPYFVPTPRESELLAKLRQRGVRVGILTNSLESCDELAAYSGYAKHRKQLLKDGIELYELKTLPGNTRGTGQTPALSRRGNYGLHAKLYVFDRRRLFIGSMNFDQRSVNLNTEVGVIIDSASLAQETAKRFENLTQPANAYAVTLVSEDADSPHLVWRTEEANQAIELKHEPARSSWQRFVAGLWSLLPIDHDL